jgi:hypothetical protein
MGLSQPLEPPICETNPELMRLHGNNECRPWHEPKVTGENRKSRNKLWGQHRIPLNPMKFHIPHFPSPFPWNLKQPLENSASRHPLKWRMAYPRWPCSATSLHGIVLQRWWHPDVGYYAMTRPKWDAKWCQWGLQQLQIQVLKRCIRVFHFGVFVWNELEWWANKSFWRDYCDSMTFIWDLSNGDMWAIASTCDELLAGESQGIHHGWLPWLPSPWC